MAIVACPSALRNLFTSCYLPAVVRQARHVCWVWSIPCQAKRDDIRQQALLHAWSDFCRLNEQGKEVRPTVLARFAVLRALSGCGLWGCGRNGKKNRTCPFDTAVQRRKGFRTVQAGQVQGKDDEQTVEPWTTGKPNSVLAEVAGKLDTEAWMGTRNREEREVINALAEGSTATEAAERAGVSDSWVSKRREAWERSWERFVAV